MRTRSVPGWGAPISEVTVSLDLPVPPGLGVSSIPKGLVREALDSGVLSFWLTAPPVAQLRALTDLLASRADSPPRTVFVCVPSPQLSAPKRVDPGVHSAFGSSDVARWQSCAGSGVQILFGAAVGVGERDALVEQLRWAEEMFRGASIDRWGIDFRGGSAPTLGEVELALGPSVGWVGGAAHLLDPSSLQTFDSALVGHEVGVVLRDPFAQGRLDGGILRPGPGSSPSTAPPASIDRLQHDYAPVLELRFLTEGGHRTLPQAAVQLGLSRPWVSTVLLPPESATPVSSLSNLESLPPLTESELARALSSGSARV